MEIKKTMRSLLVVYLLIILGLVCYKTIPKHPPISTYIADLQEQCDSLKIYQTELFERVQILEKHLDETGE